MVHAIHLTFKKGVIIMLLLISILLSSLWATGAFSAGTTHSIEIEKNQNEETKRKVLENLSALEKASYIKMPKPKKGDWMSVYKERPQTFESYILQHPVRPTKIRRTLVIQPLGDLNEEQTKVLNTMKAYAVVFFQLPVRIEKAISLPKSKSLMRILPMGRRHGVREHQYNAAEILDKVLAKRVPKDAVAYLGITMEDLYVPELNFVFGLGSFSNRVGVYSLCRYFPEFWGRTRQPGDKALSVLRSCKVLNHEAGHMLGLRHCVFFKCSMNGSNSLTETDSAPVHFCPVCHKKLIWNTKLKAKKRYRELLTFYQKHEMKEESQWLTKRIKHWTKLEKQKEASLAVEEE